LKRERTKCFKYIWALFVHQSNFIKIIFELSQVNHLNTSFSACPIIESNVHLFILTELAPGETDTESIENKSVGMREKQSIHCHHGVIVQF